MPPRYSTAVTSTLANKNTRQVPLHRRCIYWYLVERLTTCSAVSIRSSPCWAFPARRGWPAASARRTPAAWRSPGYPGLLATLLYLLSSEPNLQLPAPSRPALITVAGQVWRPGRVVQHFKLLRRLITVRRHTCVQLDN